VSPDDPRVDDLRQQLKSLGNLDAGVDRFLLAPARGTRGPVALAARSSLRVGLLGGVLLGPAVAIGLGARLPGLVSGVRDAVVLALYLGILFVLGVAAFSFVVSLATAALVRTRHDGFARRARLASATAGWIVSAACLVYLTLWWRNANAGFGWSAPVWTSFALVVAVGISLLVGHAVRITTLAVIGSAGGPTVGLPPVPAMSWRIVASGAAAFAGAAILLVLSASTAVPPVVPALTVVSTGTRVRVVAIDGFDMRTYLDHYDAATRVSKALHAASLIAVQDTTDPARAWTTLATGAVPDIHGVHGIETRRVAGLRGILASRDSQTWRLLGAAGDLVRLTRPSIASRDERRVKTVWEMAADAGLRTAVVNWWATWPAAGSGIVITDRAILRLEQGGVLDAEIAPADLYGPLRQAWPAIRARASAVAASVFDQVGDPAARAILRRSAELDITILEILRALPGPPRDLDLVYLPGLDIAQHALLAPGASGAPAPSAVAARVAALGAYYEFLQTLIEPLVDTRDDETTIIVLEPGRVETPSEGHIAVTGRLGAPGSATAGTPLDVAPTIAYALGLPLSRELTGQPMIGMLAPGLLERYPVRYVATYGRPFTPPAAREGKPLDQEMIDRLRSLGYVK
jgi:hypothetical protein